MSELVSLVTKLFFWLAVNEIGANFNPALGYVNRDGVRDTAFDVGYTKFFSGRTLQKLNFGIDGQRFDLLDGGGRQSDQLVFKLIVVESGQQHRDRNG